MKHILSQLIGKRLNHELNLLSFDHKFKADTQRAHQPAIGIARHPDTRL